jgi:hypothetical protein
MDGSGLLLCVAWTIGFALYEANDIGNREQAAIQWRVMPPSIKGSRQMLRWRLVSLPP